MTIPAEAITDFLLQHQLSDDYAQDIQQWFSEIAEDLILHQKDADRPFIVGIHGAQGSGKSTLAACLVFLFEHYFQIPAVALSLDDFYLTRKQRDKLSKEMHPLLMTRGVPGTHDIPLALSTLDNLVKGDTPISIPRFDKSQDCRADESLWCELAVAPQIIVLEGWCLGALPQSVSELEIAVNDFETTEDPDGQWRQYVNEQLLYVYPALFSRVDYWLMLKAPSFDCIYQWRTEQENKLAAKLGISEQTTQVMNTEELARFIQFYQRLTEHCLATLPEMMDAVINLDSKRNIINVTYPNHAHTAQETTTLLIFTDLDGSLLDHHTYRHDEADATLTYLESLHIPVIPVSSKTQSEIELLRDALHNSHPFICENGAAIFIPKTSSLIPSADMHSKDGYWIKEFVPGRKHWQSLINELRDEYRADFTTFYDAGIDGIIAMTGLDVHAAARAARRQYGEVISWHGSTRRKQDFCEAIQRLGAHVLKGGRFLHISGDCDKGKAIAWLTNLYKEQFQNKQFMTLAIGDSQNDLAMLEQADLALLIPSPVQPLPEMSSRHGVFVAEHSGPRGWAKSVRDILKNLQITPTETFSRGHAHG